jgi:hypothetical protein
MGECIGLEDGAAEYLAEILSNDLETDGSAAWNIATLWEVTDPEITAAMNRIQSAP